MDLYKELVNGPGYAVCPIENMQLFKKLRDSFIDRFNISNGSEKNINVIRKAMLKMSLSELNRLRIHDITHTNVSDMMVNSCPSLIEKLCGKELFIQRRAFIIFNVPGKEHQRIWNHYEMISGISPFSYVIWTPLHDLEDDGGVYIIDQEESLKVMKKEEASGLVNGPTVLDMERYQKPCQIKFGQAVIFNPFVLHGNVSFNSKLARIGCSVRIQSYNKPLLQKNSDYLKYYKLP